MQIFLRTLHSGTAVLSLDDCSTVHDLQLLVQAQQRVPVEHQLLVCGRAQLREGEHLLQAGVVSGCTVHLCLRLRGGKGGFGALLRGQGRDGKVTTNYDACRDLDGRRLRNVNAERMVLEWQAGAKAREAEKAAHQEEKETAKAAKQGQNRTVDMTDLQREQEAVLGSVNEAVERALVQCSTSKASSKRAATVLATSAKRPKCLQLSDDDDSDEDESASSESESAALQVA